jgi:hypothetical protein
MTAIAVVRDYLSRCPLYQNIWQELSMLEILQGLLDIVG